MNPRNGLKRKFDLHMKETVKPHLIGLIGDVHSEHTRLEQALVFLH